MSVLERETEEVCLHREGKKRNMLNIIIRNVFFCKKSSLEMKRLKVKQTKKRVSWSKRKKKTWDAV